MHNRINCYARTLLGLVVLVAACNDSGGSTDSENKYAGIGGDEAYALCQEYCVDAPACDDIGLDCARECRTALTSPCGRFYADGPVCPLDEQCYRQCATDDFQTCSQELQMLCLACERGTTTGDACGEKADSLGCTVACHLSLGDCNADFNVEICELYDRAGELDDCTVDECVTLRRDNPGVLPNYPCRLE